MIGLTNYSCCLPRFAQYVVAPRKYRLSVSVSRKFDRFGCRLRVKLGSIIMEHKKRMLFWILVGLFVTQVRWVDADAFVLVADLDNGTIYKGSISQGLADLAPLPLNDVVRPVAVDFDPVERMVYWTDAGQPSPKISKARLDGSGQTNIVYELDVPAGLALDIVARMVYWTDEQGHIARIPMDGSSRRKEIIVENIIQPRGIITDHDYGHIYWTDLGNNGTIERANLDGTDRTVIVQDNMLLPSGLAIDHRENKLYWCDSRLETIEQSDLLGNIRTVVIDLTPYNGTFFPFDLALLNDNLYWTDWATFTVLRVSTTGLGGRNYGLAVFQKAGGIHIYEDFCDSTPCRNGGTCTLLTAGFTCQCTPGYEGDVCQFDFCDSTPCRNGGTCTLLTAGFTCQCTPGYGGDVCQFVLGCELTHDALDIVTVSPYKRVYLPGERVNLGCPGGYEFRGSAVWYCRSDLTWNDNRADCVQLDICESSPCMNGGTCTAQTDDFTCQCAPGYEGNLCNLDNGSWSVNEIQCVEAKNAIAPIIGGVGVVLLVVAVLFAVLIFIQRKRTRNIDKRVIPIPDAQTTCGGQTNTQYQADPPPAYLIPSCDIHYEEAIYATVLEDATVSFNKPI